METQHPSHRQPAQSARGKYGARGKRGAGGRQEVLADVAQDAPQLQHLGVVLPLVHGQDVAPGDLIPVFHEWIRARCCGELLLDVADYSHVPGGPGVVLVGHQANYSVSKAGGRTALHYVRKDAPAGGNRARLHQALRAVIEAALRLEVEPALPLKLEFSRTEFELQINDRLLAPNRPETFAALEPELLEYLQPLLGEDVGIRQRQGDARELFAVEVRAARSFKLDELLAALD